MYVTLTHRSRSLNIGHVPSVTHPSRSVIEVCVCAGELVRSFVCHAVVVENCCQCGVSTNQVDPTRVHDSSTMSSECKQAGTCIARVRAGLCEVCAVSAHEAAPSLSLHEASKPLMRVTLSVSLLPLSPPMMMISQWTACPALSSQAHQRQRRRGRIRGPDPDLQLQRWLIST